MTHVDKRGAPPRLQLIDEDDAVAEELNIEAWDTDTIEEFVNERLIDASSGLS